MGHFYQIQTALDFFQFIEQPSRVKFINFNARKLAEISSKLSREGTIVRINDFKRQSNV